MVGKWSFLLGWPISGVIFVWGRVLILFYCKVYWLSDFVVSACAKMVGPAFLKRWQSPYDDVFFLGGSSLITNILWHYYLFYAWELFTKTVIEATVTGIGFSDSFQDRNLLFQGAWFRFHVGRGNVSIWNQGLEATSGSVCKRSQYKLIFQMSLGAWWHIQIGLLNKGTIMLHPDRSFQRYLLPNTLVQNASNFPTCSFCIDPKEPGEPEKCHENSHGSTGKINKKNSQRKEWMQPLQPHGRSVVLGFSGLNLHTWNVLFPTKSAHRGW